MTRLKYPANARLPFSSRVIQLQNEKVEVYKSPYYFESGGSVIDWESIDYED